LHHNHDAYQLPSPVSQNSCAPCSGDALPNSVNGIIASIRKYVAVFDLDFRIQQSAGVKCPLIDIATTISGVVRSFSNAGDTT
jgi:hypothetical protein